MMTPTGTHWCLSKFVRGECQTDSRSVIRVLRRSLRAVTVLGRRGSTRRWPVALDWPSSAKCQNCYILSINVLEIRVMVFGLRSLDRTSLLYISIK